MVTIRNVRQLVLVLVVLVHAAASLPRLVDAAVPPPVDGTDEVLSQVGFGSCSRQHFDQSYWPFVTAALTTNTAPTLHAPVAPRPQCSTTEAGNTSMTADSDGCVDGFAWLGDVIYGDACLRIGGCTPNSYAVMRETFEYFRQNKHYAAFVETVKRSPAHALAAAALPQLISSVFGEHSPQEKTFKRREKSGVAASSRPSDNFDDRAGHPSAVVSPRRVVGVWDDHDMGQNNGGAEFEHKDRNQQLLLDFLDAPQSSPRRARKGLYSVSGVPFRDEHTRGGKRSVPSESPDRNDSLRQDDQAHGRRKKEEETNASDRSVGAQLAAEYDFAVCTVLLDVRYFAELGSDLLGEPQWAWLDEVFSGGPVLDAELGPSVESQGPVSGSGSTQRKGIITEGAAHQATHRSLSERCLFTMIGSGIQVLADEKPAALRPSRDRTDAAAFA